MMHSLTAILLLLLLTPLTAFAIPPRKSTHLSPLHLRSGPTILSGPFPFPDGGTYPRATLLSSGALLGVASHPGLTSNQLTVYTSITNGTTWTQTGIVASGPGTTTSDIDNPFLLQLPSGRILCAFRNHSKANGAYTWFRITICASDDDGATWTYLGTPAQDPGPVHGNWEPFLRLSSSDPDIVQLFYSHENSAQDQDSLMRTSADAGASWSDAATISGADVTARDGMLGVVALAPGSPALLAVFESGDSASYSSGGFTVHSVFSPDDGATWGNRQVVYAPAGRLAAAPQVARTAGGQLVVSFQTDESSGQGTQVKVVVAGNSRGDGAGAGFEWGPSMLVGPALSVWGGMVAMGGGVLVMADCGGAKGWMVGM